MWFWIVIAFIAVAVYGLLRWRDRGGPRNIYQTKSDLLGRWTDPGHIDRHRGKQG